jgi:hypothetical protein
MALIPTEEAQVLRSYQVLTRQCAEERHALSGSVAVSSQAEVDNCGDMATYFCLAECLQRANDMTSMKLWLGNGYEALHDVPRSPVDLCTVVFTHWMSQTRLRGSAVFRATGLVGELAKVAQVGSGVGVEVMDACLVTMESMIDSSVIFLHARDVLAFLDVAEPILCDAHASYGTAARGGCLLADSPQCFRDWTERFKAACVSRPHVHKVLEKLRTQVREECPLILLCPLLIGRKVVQRGNSSMGHWVVIEFELKYKTDRQRTPKSLRNVLLRVGDSLVAKDNPPFQSLLLEHLCLLDVLCAVCTSFLPTRIETVNLTLDKYPAGCNLPIQVRGNGCAAYAVATIAAAKVRIAHYGKKHGSSDAIPFSEAIKPFHASLFDGEGEVNARYVLIYLAWIRLYQYGRFVVWSQPSAGEGSMMVRYVAWEIAHGAQPDTVEAIEVCFRGSLSVVTVLGCDESSGFSRDGRFLLGDNFLRRLAGGIRKFVPAFQNNAGLKPCMFYKSPQYTKELRAPKRGRNGSKVLAESNSRIARWTCTHVRHVCAVEKKCQTNLVLAHEPGSNIFEVKLRLRPSGHSISLHTPPEDGVRPLSDLLS